MNRFFSLLFTAAVGLTAPTTATAQTVTVPYNPDGDANGLIGVTDLQDLLIYLRRRVCTECHCGRFH